MKHVPVVQAVHDDGTPLTDEEINAYRLADNKTGELASWDFDMLNEEIDNIKDIDMSQFGFDDIEEPDLPDNFFEEDDSGNDSTDDSEDKPILDWGTNSAEITILNSIIEI
ncbi:hypothetical protein [Lactobacillus helveticus]|uniref:hypothetical protein n=1 Tax=Lactobacillus helveticus TaxID=1587 RepID=UPI0015E8E976